MAVLNAKLPLLPLGVDALKKRLPRTQIRGTTFWVAEGDLLLGEDDLAPYLAGFVAPLAPHVPPSFAMSIAPGMKIKVDHGSDLVAVRTHDGGPLRWPADTRFTYKIDESTFEDAPDGTQVVIPLAHDLAAATADWQSACNVVFEQLDPTDDADPLFLVQFGKGDEALYAHSFFPEDERGARVLMIRPRYYRDESKPVRPGILRHELGHILGFRHEHLSPKAPPECSTSDSDFPVIALTRFDRNSIMSVFCRAGDKLPIALTDSDRKGAASVYGAPAPAGHE